MTKRLTLSTLILWTLIASAMSLKLNFTFFESLFVFLVLPAAYLSLLAHQHVKRLLLVSTIAIPIGILIDYLAQKNAQWIVPHTVFPFRLFGYVPIEDVLWIFFLAYYVLIFYKYFLDTKVDKKLVEPRIKYLAVVFVLVPIIVLLGENTFLGYLESPNFYFWGGILGLALPIAIICIRHEELHTKVFKTFLFFFFFSLTYEITGLLNGWWYFPTTTDFVGWVYIYGVAFPLEELLFFITLFAAATVCYYEFFDEDLR